MSRRPAQRTSRTKTSSSARRHRGVRAHRRDTTHVVGSRCRWIPTRAVRRTADTARERRVRHRSAPPRRSWTQALTAGVRTATAPRYVEDLAVLDARCEHIDHLAALGTPLELAHRSAPGGAVISSRNPQVASGKRGQKGTAATNGFPPSASVARLPRKNRLLAGGSPMARPGLEPGTPRFSDRCRERSNGGGKTCKPAGSKGSTARPGVAQLARGCRPD
jgi:hypothetical protein